MRPGFDYAGAISRHAVLEFEYDGKRRLVEPHAYGLSTAGNYAIRAFQVRSGDGREDSGWRLFLTSQIYGVYETGAYFRSAREGYETQASDFVEIFQRYR